jgi:signal transduction histidine kinase
MAEILSWTACALLSAALAHALWSRHALQRAWNTERAALQDLTRLVRLTAGDLRATALALLGRAQSAPDTDRGFLLSTQAALLDMTEALLRQTETRGASHHLQDEAVRLRPVLDFVVAQITCQLGPGHRAWRIAEDLHGIEMLADRRALHQILLRVLTAAALSTRDGDWITITGGWSTAFPDGGWTLAIEDEGAGLAIDATRLDGRDTRGLGVGLTLAQSLMQAHGGALVLQSAASVGTRAGLVFPAARILAG